MTTFEQRRARRSQMGLGERERLIPPDTMRALPRDGQAWAAGAAWPDEDDWQDDPVERELAACGLTLASATSAELDAVVMLASLGP